MSLVIGAILISVVFQLMVGQTRSSGMQSAREEAQQNARGALEILSSELRSAMPEGLVSAEPQSLTFMQPRAWGILCANAANATQVDVLFPAATPAGAWQVSNASGILVRQPFTPPAVPTWLPARTTTQAGTLAARARITGAQTLGAPAANVCQGLNAHLNNQGATLQVVRLTSSVGLTGQRGTVVALYTLTRYDLATTNGEPWLRRNAGMASANAFNPQPLAGPIAPEPNRFLLTYLDENGNTLAAPGSNPGLLDAVRQVRFRVVTRSSQTIDGIAQRDSGEMLVLLRN